MWLYIDDDPLPRNIRKARESDLSEDNPHDGFWLNIDTGAMIFLGPVRKPKDAMDRDQIRVYWLPPGTDVSAIDVTAALTDRTWRFIESQVNETTVHHVRATLVAALTKRLT
jgi:hypothetical protein